MRATLVPAHVSLAFDRSLHMTGEAFAKAMETKNRSCSRLKGLHVETYWGPQYVEAALSKVIPFYES